MITNRRVFLRAGVTMACGAKPQVRPPSHDILKQARNLIERGSVGRVAFCRLERDNLMGAARYVLGPLESDCLIEVQDASEGLALLGTDATLVVSSGGCRLFRDDRPCQAVPE